jgi:glutaredoxin
MPHGVTVQPECVVRKTQPTKPIVLYEFEACPFCRRVRETATQLDLQLVVKPCPKDALTHRDEAMNNGNTKGTFPFLVDENTGTAMGESEDIARYLWATYGEQTEFPEAVVSSTLFTGWMPTLLRAGRGMTRYASADTNNAKNNSEKNNQPNITLYNYEGNQFARLVRYVLRVSQIPPTLFYLSAGDCLSMHRDILEPEGTSYLCRLSRVITLSHYERLTLSFIHLKDVEWTRLFDVVITGSCKPGFFENERTAVFEVDVETSDLRNTDDGAPMTPIGASEAEDAPFAGLASFAKRKAGQKDSSIYPPLPGAYQGGSFKHLHAMLGVSSGNQVLYVGDHIYGDVMRSKKTLGWRTMLVVPELAHELDCLEEAEKSGVFEKIRTARTERDALSDETQLRVWRASVVRDASIEAGSGWGGGSALQSSEGAEGSDSDGGDGLRDFGNDPELAELTKRALDAKNKHRETLRELHGTFHPTWGQLMKAGSQNSRFAHQLETYACLYTSHARNLVAYSPRKTYRGQSDWMPHDANDAEHR